MCPTQLTFKLALPSQCDFNHFIVGDNQEALSVLALPHTEPSVALWGAIGSGKTHLLKAWIHQASLQKIPALYINARHTALSLAVQHAQCLAIDHVDTLGPEAQITLLAIYNAFRALPNTRLLVASTLPPAQLTLRDDLRTRLCAGLVYEIHALSDEQKLVALRAYAQNQQIHLPESVLQYLLRHFQRDLTTLTRLINTLDREALSRHHAITLPFLKSILSI